MVEQIAISNYSGLGKLKLAPMPELNSMSSYNQNSLYFRIKSLILGISATSFFKEVDIEVETLDSYCAKNNMERIGFLKIDTEGHELQVLEGALNLLLNKRISVIQIEVSNTKQRVTQTHLVEDLLSNFGFSKKKCFNHVWGNFSDCIYILDREGI